MGNLKLEPVCFWSTKDVIKLLDELTINDRNLG